MEYALWILILVIGWSSTIVWALLLNCRVRELKAAYKQSLFFHNKMVGLYVKVARQNRELVLRYNKFKAGVRDSFFAQIMTTQEVIDFYNKCDVPQGDAKVDESHEEIVEKLLSDGRANTRYWNFIFTGFSHGNSKS